MAHNGDIPTDVQRVARALERIADLLEMIVEQGITTHVES